MNKRRLGIIAKWLEDGAPHKKGVDGFDMCAVKREMSCGTVCCLAGAANQFFGNAEERNCQYSDPARDLLDLNYFEFDELTEPRQIRDWKSITPAWAARVVRKLIATGEVDWEGTREAVEA